MNELEGILISAMEPKLNKQGAKLSDAHQFYQAVDENVVDLSLQDISKQLIELQSQVSKIQKKIDKM